MKGEENEWERRQRERGRQGKERESEGKRDFFLKEKKGEKWRKINIMGIIKSGPIEKCHVGEWIVLSISKIG